VVAPILLYHHVGVPEEPSPYYVSPEAFRLQGDTRFLSHFGSWARFDKLNAHKGLYYEPVYDAGSRSIYKCAETLVYA
jgi:hypothetical protein